MYLRVYQSYYLPPSAVGKGDPTRMRREMSSLDECGYPTIQPMRYLKINVYERTRSSSHSVGRRDDSKKGMHNVEAQDTVQVTTPQPLTSDHTSIVTAVTTTKYSKQDSSTKICLFETRCFQMIRIQATLIFFLADPHPVFFSQ